MWLMEMSEIYNCILLQVGNPDSSNVSVDTLSLWNTSGYFKRQSFLRLRFAEIAACTKCY
jgi:hypothetical protein